MEFRGDTGVQRCLTERLVTSRLQRAGQYKGWQMTDNRRERHSYVRRAGVDEGGQGWDGRTVLREIWRRQERRKTGRRRQETEECGKDYQMRRWRLCGEHLTPDKGKKRKRERTKVQQNRSIYDTCSIISTHYKQRISDTAGLNSAAPNW